MNKACITLTKYKDIFNDRDTGNPMEYEYIEIEFAPNLFVKLSLKSSNLRVLAKYNPDLYQLICNTPHFDPIIFSEEHEPEEPQGVSGIKDIYGNNEISDDEEQINHKSKKRLIIH